MKKYKPVYAGNRQRYSTATATMFVNETTILVASFLKQTIYLIELTEDSYKIIDSIEIYGNPDLIDYKDGLIVTANFPALACPASLTIMSLNNNKIKLKKNINLPELAPHGVRIIDEKNYVVASSDRKNGVFFVNYDTGITREFKDFNYNPKDIFILENRLLISSSLSKPSGSDSVVEKDSILYLFDFPDLNKLDELSFFGQTDAIGINGRHGFIALQAQDSLLHFTLENDKLSFIKTIGGFDFPHGVASYNNKVIVTNYGNNSFDVLNLNDLVI